MKLWIDDEREKPRSFDLCVRTASAAIDIIKTGAVTFVSFDHDLGDGGTGYEVARFVEEGAFLGTVKRFGWSVHSQNPVGAANVVAAMVKAEQYWRRNQS